MGQCMLTHDFGLLIGVGLIGQCMLTRAFHHDYWQTELIELTFNVPADTKYVLSMTFYPVSLSVLA